MNIFNSLEIWLFISIWALGAACGIGFSWWMDTENQKYLRNKDKDD